MGNLWTRIGIVRKLWAMKERVFRWGWAGLLLAVAVLAACGGDDDDDTRASEETYDEGSVRMEIETLDTGLLKGHSYAEAAEGWTVKEVHVNAVTPDGQEWPVIEIPEASTPEQATLFFEVTIGELPRGEKVAITTVTTFMNESGEEIERTAEDSWPP